ncbi:MAG: GNAT family N-acetyltransferase [Candidatus Aenigmarchaeota archaeon]|nr:GNAT family N-acetyltransferase [Candidatus Aenigmarchaeota archaeon]
MDFNVRRATPDDTDTIRYLVKTNNIINPRLNASTGFLVYDTSIEQIKSCDFPYVAEALGGITGFLLVYTPEADRRTFGSTFEEIWKDAINGNFEPNWLHAHQIATKADYTGRGVRKMLWEMAERQARENGFERFYAEMCLVSPNNRSLSIHETEGWKPLGERIQTNAYVDLEGQRKAVKWGLYTKEFHH